MLSTRRVVAPQLGRQASDTSRLFSLFQWCFSPELSLDFEFAPIGTRCSTASSLAQLLETKIAQFVPPKGTTDKFQLRDAILSLPEVKQLLQTNNVAVRPYDYAYGRSIYSNGDVDLRISNTDVRAVLNHVAKETEHKIWFVEVGKVKELLVTY